MIDAVNLNFTRERITQAFIKLFYANHFLPNTERHQRTHALSRRESHQRNKVRIKNTRIFVASFTFRSLATSRKL